MKHVREGCKVEFFKSFYVAIQDVYYSVIVHFFMQEIDFIHIYASRSGKGQ